MVMSIISAPKLTIINYKFLTKDGEVPKFLRTSIRFGISSSSLEDKSDFLEKTRDEIRV